MTAYYDDTNPMHQHALERAQETADEDYVTVRIPGLLAAHVDLARGRIGRERFIRCVLQRTLFTTYSVGWPPFEELPDPIPGGLRGIGLVERGSE